MSAISFVQTTSAPGPALRRKRALDLSLLLLSAPVVLPVILMLALAVRVMSKGPVFFLQTRVGQGGRPFRMVKFRTMAPGAELRRAALLAQSDRAGPCFKRRDDPRVTPIGGFLRRSSLDELPQLWNVLKGEMSLVGPRPALPEEVARYPSRAIQRLAGLPGLTGLWQVSGRADLSFDQMIDLDLAYLRNPGLRNDLRILWRTLGAVVAARGAY